MAVAPLLPRADRLVSAAFVVLLLTIVTTVVVGVVGAEPAQADPVYRPPVEGTITDPFRAPEHRFGPGNRGLDYAVTPLSPVRASADGEVIFAGPVAGTLHVTVRHADGLRTSYSFLASIAVTVGQRVRAGDELGRTTEVFHFGVRDPAGTYLDPALLFAAPTRARLVPGGDDGTESPPPEASLIQGVIDERRGALEAVLARGLSGRALGPAPTLVERTRLWAHLLLESTRVPHDVRIAAGLRRWWAERDRCTPAEVPPPPITGRRILVQVGGIGSTSEHAAVARVDAPGLGYAEGDVVRFSYRGGRVGGTAQTGPLDRLPVQPYTAVDSQADPRVVAGHLADLLSAVAAAAPGVPIDVVAHSQGGIVARLALDRAQRAGRLPPSVETLVTLGTPHHGAELAAVVQAGRLTVGGRRVMSTIGEALGVTLDAELPAAAALAPASSVMDELARTPPPSVRLVSIGARGDLVVPAGRTVLADAPSSIVSVSGARAHDRLPSSPEATREIALAVAGRHPTCRSFTDAMADLVVGERIAQAEAALGLVVAALPAGSRGDLKGFWPVELVGAPCTFAGPPAEAIHSSAGPADVGPLHNDIIAAAHPRSRTACRRSRRAAVSPNRGKEIPLWHLS